MALALILVLALAALAIDAERWPTRAELARALEEGPRRRPNRQRRRLELDAIYRLTERRLGGTAAWRCAARLGERAGVRSTPAETLLSSAGAGIGLAVVAAAAGISGPAVGLALLAGAGALPAALHVRGRRGLRRA